MSGLPQLLAHEHTGHAEAGREGDLPAIGLDEPVALVELHRPE